MKTAKFIVIRGKALMSCPVIKHKSITIRANGHEVMTAMENVKFIPIRSKALGRNYALDCIPFGA